MLKKKNMKNITTKKVSAVLLHSRGKPQCPRFPRILAGQGFRCREQAPPGGSPPPFPAPAGAAGKENVRPRPPFKQLAQFYCLPSIAAARRLFACFSKSLMIFRIS
jgi:hypothetical protein